MPSYAILGATGAAGSQVLRILTATQHADTQINIFVRSRQKLLRLLPDIGANKNVHVFEGQIDDISTIAVCITNTDAVFLTIGRNENTPGMHICQEAAESVVQALKGKHTPDPREGQPAGTPSDSSPTGGRRVPRLVVLTSSSVNPIFQAQKPFLVRTVIDRAFNHAYADLRAAESFLRGQAEWLRVVYVQPGLLMEGPATGYRLDTKRVGRLISYGDLAKAMVEVAQVDDFDGAGVAVIAENPGSVNKDVSLLLRRLLTGLWAHYFPGLIKV